MFKETDITRLIIHKVGNMAREESNTLSEKEIELVEEQKPLFLDLFLKNIKVADYYKFVGTREENKVYDCVASLTESRNDFEDISQELAEEYLSAVSNDPKIPNSEFYVAQFTDVNIGTDFVKAVGIFVTETTEPYLQIEVDGENIEAKRQDGVSIKKLAKGCLILDTDKDKGYKVLHVDKTKLKGLWSNEYLNINQAETDFAITKTFIQSFVSVAEDMADEDTLDRKSLALLKQETEAFFNQEDDFDYDNFEQVIFKGEELGEVFKAEIEEVYALTKEEMPTEFGISQTCVKSCKPLFKSVIKLDENFIVEVKGDVDAMEVGFDDHLNKGFYKLYFNEAN